jgi:hypothetical protein
VSDVLAVTYARCLGGPEITHIADVVRDQIELIVRAKAHNDCPDTSRMHLSWNIAANALFKGLGRVGTYISSQLFFISHFSGSVKLALQPDRRGAVP